MRLAKYKSQLNRPPRIKTTRSQAMPAPALKAAVIAPSDETAAAAEIVEKFLVASMVPDPETAARYIAEPLKLTFTGGRRFSHPRESTAFNAKRYKWVKKAM